MKDLHPHLKYKEYKENFKEDLNMEMVDEDLMWRGRPFQSLGAATEKA